MEIGQILEALELNRGYFPYGPIRESIARKEEMAPELLHVLEEALANPAAPRDPAYFAPIHALYLLAQFREKAAYPLIIRLISNPIQVLDKLIGDVTTDGLESILASVAHGDTDPIKAIIEDESINEYVRSAALRSLVVSCVEGEMARDELVGYFLSLFRGRLKREHDFVWSALVSCCCRIHPLETYEEIIRAFDEGLVETFFVNLRNVECALKDQTTEGAMDDLKRDERFRFVTDTVASLEWWACFRPSKEARREMSKKAIRKAIRAGGAVNPNTPENRKTLGKIGRNAPCPCGSGKKYKKCCGA